LGACPRGPGGRHEQPGQPGCRGPGRPGQYHHQRGGQPQRL